MPVQTAPRDRSATAGARDRVIAIQERPPGITKDTTGTPIDGPWDTYLDGVWAERQDLEGRERFQADQLATPYDTRWRIPYHASMDPEIVNVPKLRRIVFRGRVHDIVFAKQLGRAEGIEILTVATTKEP